MNAATLLTAKGLILALGGSLTLTASPATTPAAAATSYLKVDLGATATHPLSATYVNPPTGAVTLGTVPFTTANIALLTSGTKLDLTASTSKPVSVSVLVNSAYGFDSFKGQTVGRVHLTFSDATTQDTDLVAGSQIREWWLGPGYLSTLASTSATNVWQGQGQPATGIGTATAVIDMLTATVNPTNASLSSVSVQNIAGAPFDLMVSGVTVAYTTPVVGGGTGGNNKDKDKNDNDRKDVNRVNPPKPVKGESTEKTESDEHEGTTKPEVKKPAATPKPISARHTDFRPDSESTARRTSD